jgi:HSP20 family protein
MVSHNGSRSGSIAYKCSHCFGPSFAQLISHNNSLKEEDMNFPSLFRTNNGSSRELSRLQKDFDCLFSELSDMEPFIKSDMSCSCELLEDNSNFTFKFDMPGIKKEDIKVEVDGNVLTVSAERSEEKKSDGKKSRYSEVSYGSYQRSFTLPDIAEEAKVGAKFENGVLTLTVPKAQTSNSKQISIQ